MGYSEMQSVIDSSKMVYPDQWVLSLVVKPQGKNPEHAIMIVEGINEKEEFVYRRYDFVMEEAPKTPIEKGKALALKGNGLVLIKDKLQNTSDYPETARIDYFWKSIMKDRHMIEGCRGASWIINDAQAKFLHDEVEKDQAAPPDYQISGEHAFATSSSSQSGKNCFTWARTKIKSIKDHQGIQQDERLQEGVMDKFAARTSRYLTPPDEDSTSSAPKYNIM